LRVDQALRWPRLQRLVGISEAASDISESPRAQVSRVMSAREAARIPAKAFRLARVRPKAPAKPEQELAGKDYQSVYDAVSMLPVAARAAKRSPERKQRLTSPEAAEPVAAPFPDIAIARRRRA
jgi:hypothetical protein